MPGEFLLQFLRVIGAGRPRTSWLTTVKNNLSSHNLNVEKATEQATLETVGSTDLV